MSKKQADEPEERTPYEYNLKYKLDFDPGKYLIEKEEDAEENCGYTDALLVVSCLRPPTGEYSQQFFSMDGVTGKPMTQSEIFKAWLCIAAAIGQHPDSTPFQREICQDIFKGVMDLMTQAAKMDEAKDEFEGSAEA